MKRLVLTIAILIGLAAPAWAGFAEGLAAYKRGDYATALREFRPLAKQGDGVAQSIFGVMYYKGRGVPQGYAKAVKWYSKAAEQGNAIAQYNLGLMYVNGEGVAQDYAKAAKWFLKAAKWFRKAAEQGHAEAQYRLGGAYALGRGVPQDYLLAHMWINLAAGQSHAGALKARILIEEAYLTPAQIAEAQRMAREWKPKKEGK